MAEIIEYKCPNCDGIITFDSQSQKNEMSILWY